MKTLFDYYWKLFTLAGEFFLVWVARITKSGVSADLYFSDYANTIAVAVVRKNGRLRRLPTSSWTTHAFQMHRKG